MGDNLHCNVDVHFLFSINY